jgi:hypothetical protein
MKTPQECRERIDYPSAGLGLRLKKLICGSSRHCRH